MQHITRTPKQIGDAVRRQRRRLGLSQSTIGEQVQMRQATISALETGQGDTQLSTLCDILAALGLELVVRTRTTSSPSDMEELF